MDSVISITVFLVPGLVASRLNAALDPNYKDRKRESSELESTIYAILNNLPGILIGWLLWSAIQQKPLSFAEFRSDKPIVRGFRLSLYIISISLWR